MRGYFPRTAAWCLAGAALISPCARAATAVWLEVDESSGVARARLGELTPGVKPGALPVLAEARASMADGRALPLTPQDGGYLFKLPAGADVRLVAKALGADGSLTIYEARAGRRETQSINEMELVPTQPNGNTFRLLWKGAQVPGAQVKVNTSAGWTRATVTADDGSIVLPTPFAGRYVLDVSAKVSGKTPFGGKVYDDARHTVTLTFDVPERK